MNQREIHHRTLRHPLPELDPALWSEVESAHLLLAGMATALEQAAEVQDSGTAASDAAPAPGAVRASDAAPAPGAVRASPTAGARPVRAPATPQPPLPPCCTSPLRCLVLALLCREPRLGVTPSRLARLLAVRRSSLAHHLDVLEGAGLILRSPRRIWDGRKVTVRLTAEGAAALDRIQQALARARRGSSGAFAGHGSRPSAE